MAGFRQPAESLGPALPVLNVVFRMRRIGILHQSIQLGMGSSTIACEVFYELRFVLSTCNLIPSSLRHGKTGIAFSQQTLSFGRSLVGLHCTMRSYSGKHLRSIVLTTPRPHVVQRIA